jgi:hypothetical protein
MSSPHQNPRIYRAPAEEIPADDFAVVIDGLPVFTHRARVSAYPVNQFLRPYQRPLEQTELASFASWEMSAPVEVEVQSFRPVNSVIVRPRSAGVVPETDGDFIRFTIRRPGQYVVEVNDYHKALHLFADPPERDIPDPADPDVTYFGPGVHCAGLVPVRSGQTVYLAAGAVVYGAILAEHEHDITVCGRGILDGSRFDRYDLTSLLCFYDCTNVRIDGIVVRDSSAWTLVSVRCRDVHIRGVKIIGNWRYNSDGIDFLNCTHCSLEDSFIRAFDDCIDVKGYSNYGPFVHRLRLVKNVMENRFMVDGIEGSFAELQERFGIYPCPQDGCRDLAVRRCVVWCDWARSLVVGPELVADEVSGILFEDCDLVHATGTAMCVTNYDRALCRDIVFRDIRVELDDSPPRPIIVTSRNEPYEKAYDGYLPTLVNVSIQVGYVSFDTTRGCIEDIRFENIEVVAPGMPQSRIFGYDDTHPVRRVRINDLRLNGQRVDDPAAAGIRMNEFTEDVELDTERVQRERNE